MPSWSKKAKPVVNIVSNKEKRAALEAAQKKDFNPLLQIVINSAQATPAPPLGPALGERGLNVGLFCKDFNEKTKDMTPGIPLPCDITINHDRSYQLNVLSPTTEWMLLQAAGIRRAIVPVSGVEFPEATAGYITRKHVYEIAKMRALDEINIGHPLKEICEDIVLQSLRMGIKIVDKIDPAKYKEFLVQRKSDILTELQKEEEEKAAKLLRTTTAKPTKK